MTAVIELPCLRLVKKRTVTRSRMNQKIRFRLDYSTFLGSVLLAGVLALSSLTASAEDKAAATVSPWQRIVMIGASVTSGFVASEPLGGTNTEMHRLSRYVDAALLVPHDPIKNLGSPFLFLQPEVVGPQQIEQALQAKPTLVVGVDFMFWFCYGAGKTDADRLQRLETGLKLLDKFDCPVVVGDIPNASAATNMLRPDQIPSAEALTAANKRLKEWVAGRKQGAIVPLSDFMRNGMANQPIKIRDYTVPEGKSRALLQRDRLHPSPSGCAVIALSLLEEFQATRSGNNSQDFRHDGQEIFRLVTSAVKVGAAPAVKKP